MINNANIPVYIAWHMTEIDSRKLFLRFLCDQILKTSANLFLKEQLLFLWTPLKSSKLNPVYPMW